MLLGSPISIMEDMPDICSNSFSIAYGNFKVGYLIVDRPGVRILRDPYTTKGQTKVYAYQYVGGDVLNHAAIKLLKFSAA
jgi:HK97 family phage major capsid protein